MTKLVTDPFFSAFVINIILWKVTFTSKAGFKISSPAPHVEPQTADRMSNIHKQNTSTFIIKRPLFFLHTWYAVVYGCLFDLCFSSDPTGKYNWSPLAPKLSTKRNDLYHFPFMNKTFNSLQCSSMVHCVMSCSSNLGYACKLTSFSRSNFLVSLTIDQQLHVNIMDKEWLMYKHQVQHVSLSI